MREVLTGSTKDFTKEPEVWDEVRKQISTSLEGGHTTVLDSTLAKMADRTAMMTFAREHNAEKIQGVYMDVPLEIAKQRTAVRETEFPEKTIERMERELAEHGPEFTEGFDSILIFDEKREVKEVHMRREGEDIHHEMKLR